MVRKQNKGEISIELDEDTKYILKTPTGPIGWKHAMFMMEIESAQNECPTEPRIMKFLDDDGKEYEKEVEVRLNTPRLREITMQVMDKWIKEVLPEILVSHTFDEVPWTDMAMLFDAVIANKNYSFRDLEKPE